MKKGGESERLEGKEGEEGVRREEGGVWNIPSTLTACEPMFCPSNTASSRQLLSSTWTVGEDVDSSERRGWPLPSTGMGKRDKGTCPYRGRQRLNRCRRSERYDTNPPVKEQETWWSATSTAKFMLVYLCPGSHQRCSPRPRADS